MKNSHLIIIQTKKVLSFFLICILLLASCSSKKTTDDLSNVKFDKLDDSNLAVYIEQTLYTNLLNNLNSDSYFIENISTIYLSKEYLEELEYNSKSNVFFGFTLDEINSQFQDTKYVFTHEDNRTIVKEFEDYDDTVDRIIKNVAIGTGVIFLCVTVSIVTAPTLPAVSSILMISAKTGTEVALQGGALSALITGIVTGFDTKNFDETIKASSLAFSEGFKFGAIFGSITGGITQALTLKGGTLNGLSMNQVAKIQNESGYPIDVIKQLQNIEQYEILKNGSLIPKLVDGKVALVQSIDLKYIDEMGRTNLQRMEEGLAAIDPISKKSIELHHIGQKTDSTLAMLTKAQHTQGGNSKIWHSLDNPSDINRALFAKQRDAFWKSLAEQLS